MKTLLAFAAVTFFGTAAYAGLPQCSGNFCAGAQNGGNCQIAGEVHTCGKCTGTPNGILYKGDLSDATALEKCQQHVNKNNGRIQNLKANSAAAAKGDKNVKGAPTSGKGAAKGNGKGAAKGVRVEMKSQKKP
ncbi:MAG: hypothetical protein ACE366_08140 [Bradymonadia bacterium]